MKNRFLSWRGLPAIVLLCFAIGAGRASADATSDAALLKAVSSCDPDATRAALAAGANPNASFYPNQPGNFVLTYAVDRALDPTPEWNCQTPRRIEIPYLLLEAGADPRTKTWDGMTIPERRLTFISVGSGHHSIQDETWPEFLRLMRAFQARGFSPNEPWTVDHRHDYFAYDVQGESRMLGFSFKGSSPLHLAAWLGNVDLLRVYLEAPGVRLDLTDADGYTPLDLLARAVRNYASLRAPGGTRKETRSEHLTRWTEAARLLLERGAATTGKDGDVLRVVLNQIGLWPDSEWSSELDAIGAFLLRHGHPIEVSAQAGTFETTSLGISLWNGLSATALELIDRGVDLEHWGRASLAAYSVGIRQTHFIPVIPKSIDPEVLRRFRLDPDWLIRPVTRHLGQPSNYRVVDELFATLSYRPQEQLGSFVAALRSLASAGFDLHPTGVVCRAFSASRGPILAILQVVGRVDERCDPVRLTIQSKFKDRVAILEALFALGADPNGLGARKIVDALIGWGNVEIYRVLKRVGTNLRQTGMVADAVGLGNERLVFELLKDGYDPEEPDAQGRPPLQLAVLSNRAEIVSELLVRGADPNRLEGGDAAKHKRSLLMLALGYQTIKARDLLLADLRTSIEHEDSEGYRALYYAQTPDDVAALFARGATHAPQGWRRYTPVHIMLLRKSLPLLKAVLRHGPDLGARDKEGNTPVQMAIAEGLPVEFVVLLCQRGAPDPQCTP